MNDRILLKKDLFEDLDTIDQAVSKRGKLIQEFNEFACDFYTAIANGNELLTYAFNLINNKRVQLETKNEILKLLKRYNENDQVILFLLAQDYFKTLQGEI